jgi:hypothetical protein
MSLGSRFGDWVGATLRRYPPWATVIAVLFIVAAAFALPVVLLWPALLWLLRFFW